MGNLTGEIQSKNWLEHNLLGVRLGEGSDVTSVKNLQCDGHLLIKSTNTSNVGVRWSSVSVGSTEWSQDDICFNPSGSDISIDLDEAVSARFLCISDSYFRDAAKGHIDYGRIELRLARMKDSFVSAVTASVHQMIFAGDFGIWPLLVETTMLSLAVSIIKEISPAANMAFSPIRYGLCDVKKKRTVEYIYDNLHRQISLSELADNVALSKFHFSRQFSNSVGQSPLKFLAEARVEAAKKRLRSSSDSIAQISFECGFASQAHMTTVFRKVANCTPAEYRFQVV